MKYIRFAVLAVLIGCSTAIVDVDKKLEELGVTSTESKNFAKPFGALRHACKESDSTSIQSCQLFKHYQKPISDTESFVNKGFFSPDSLNDIERRAFNDITVLGAVYREYIQARQAQADSDRFWNAAAAAGAAFGTLFSRPSTPPNCHIYNAHTPSPYVQCQ